MQEIPTDASPSPSIQQHSLDAAFSLIKLDTGLFQQRNGAIAYVPPVPWQRRILPSFTGFSQRQFLPQFCQGTVWTLGHVPTAGCAGNIYALA
jgi:hypothetical protein